MLDFLQFGPTVQLETQRGGDVLSRASQNCNQISDKAIVLAFTIFSDVYKECASRKCF